MLGMAAASPTPITTRAESRASSELYAAMGVAACEGEWRGGVEGGEGGVDSRGKWRKERRMSSELHEPIVVAA